MNGSADQPVLLCAYAGTGYFEEAVWAVICAYFNRDAAVAANGVTFFAKEEGVERVKAV